MPDLVADALGRVHRSRRRFTAVMATALAALVLAAAAFTFSLRANWQHTHAAAGEAHAAAGEARHAAADARHALTETRVNRAALCVFLASAEREAPGEAAADAKALARAYQCPHPPGGLTMGKAAAIPAQYAKFLTALLGEGIAYIQLYGTTWHLEPALVMIGAALAVLGVPNAAPPPEQPAVRAVPPPPASFPT